MLHERLRPAAVCTARPTYSTYSPAREQRAKDRCYVRPCCDSFLASIDPTYSRPSLAVEEGWGERKRERERDDFRQLLPSTFRSRDIAKVYSHRAARNTRSTRSYCAIKLMAKEKKSERKPTDELDLWWKLVIRRSKENNLWIERNGCNVFFRSGRRVLYVKLIPTSGERFSIQGYSR